MGRCRPAATAVAAPAAEPAPAAPVSPASPPKSPVKIYEMAFEEGDEVMSKWPGTALFFKSKVTYVRADDNEYDIQFEDGTVYTLKAKEVRKTVKVAASKTERRRSRSRGRSPARKTAESPEAPKKPATPKVVKAPKTDRDAHSTVCPHRSRGR